jgi:acetoin utilization deacetylase AcuC-like enzyme
MVSSEGFGMITSKLVDAATELCGGRLIFAHEGGYSKDYVGSANDRSLFHLEASYLEII